MKFMAALFAWFVMSGAASADTWTADNGDGTFSKDGTRFTLVASE